MPPVTALHLLRKKIIEKLYAPRSPVIGQATGAGSTTTIVDNILAPSALLEDYVGAWILGNAAIYSAASATLNGAHSATITSITYTSSGDPVVAGDYFMIDDEIMLASSVDSATNIITAVRGQAGTTAAAHITASLILHYKPSPLLIQTAAGVVSPGGAASFLSRVTNTTFTGASSTITIAPAIAALLGAGGKYEIHYKFSPRAVNNKINEIMENMRRTIWEPLTIVSDGSMEAVDASGWDDALSNAAVSKVTTGDGIVFGRRSLRVTNSGVNGYAQSQPIYLPPKSDIVVAALATVQSGTGDAILNILSSPDGTTYTSVETARIDNASRDNVLLIFMATVPTGAQDIIIRLTGTSANNVIDWNFVVVLPTTRRLWNFPSLLERHHDFTELYYLEPGSQISLNDSEFAYRFDEHTMRKFAEVSVFVDESAVVPFRLELRGRRWESIMLDHVLFVKANVNYARLEDDITTTNAPEDVVVDLATADLLDDWAQEDREAGRLEQAKSKEDRANVLRIRLAPRMMQIHKPHGLIQGAMRPYSER